MKLFIDANVLLDVLLSRQPSVECSVQVLDLCAKKKAVGCCSGLTVCNLMYILRKHCTLETARQCMSDFATFVEIVDVKSASVIGALHSANPDFEDAVQVGCAATSGADAIVTRDKIGFEDAGIPVYTPAELISLFT